MGDGAGTDTDIIDDERVERLRRLANEKFKEMTEIMDYDDFELVVALDDSALMQLVLLILNEAKGPVSWREFKAITRDIVGEDRLRRALRKLVAMKKVRILTRTRYVLA